MKKFSQRLLLINALVLGVLYASSAFAAETYTIDKTHSTIGFSVTHLMVSTVRGEFTDYAGTVSWDPNDPSMLNTDVAIKAASIDTRVPDRDEHLRKADFLDVANFPAITFKSKTVRKEGSAYLITGDLTIRGVTKEVIIPASINGPVKSLFGKEVIGLNGRVTINRQDYGVSWNKKMDQGGLVVSDDVTIEINLEAGKETPKPEEKQEQQPKE